MTNVPASNEHQEWRVNRGSAMAGKGSYWDLCRFDAGNQAMAGILSMPTGLPAFMLDEQASAAVWALWYGSQKEARKAADRAPRKQTPHELSLCPDLRTLTPFVRLSRRLDLDLFAVATSEAGEFTLHGQHMMPLVQLMPVLESMIGAELSMQIYQMAMGVPAEDLAAAVEADFPFMKQIHASGYLKRSTCQHLLGIACLLRKLRALGDDPRATAHSNLCRLLINIICRTLPDRIGSLAAATSAEIAECFPYPVSFAGITLAQHGPDSDIWSKVELCTLDDTLHGLYGYQFPFFAHPEVDQLVMRLDSLLLSKKDGQQIGLEANAIYQDFLGVLALVQHSQLSTLMQDGGVFFAAKPFEVPEDMVRPGFSMMISGREREAARGLNTLLAAAYAAGDIGALCDEVTAWRIKIEKVGKRIEELGGKGASQKNVSKMQSIGRRTGAELDEGRAWFVEEVMGLKPLVEAWEGFYDEFSSMKP
ncbi:hypothetical protein ACRCPS_17650 [Pseudomonas aeruginosa]